MKSVISETAASEVSSVSVAGTKSFATSPVTPGNPLSTNVCQREEEKLDDDVKSINSLVLQRPNDNTT